MRTGHFGKAALECNISQPTLSMQIQKLEDDLGVVLFDRSKKPILPTDLGKQIIEQMQLILFEAKKVPLLIKKNQNKDLVGTLTIGVIPTIAPYLLPILLPVIDKKHPDLQLNILELQTHRIIDALGNDEIDVGILATPLKIPKIFEVPLYYEIFSLLSPKNHPLSKKKKINYEMLPFEEVWLLEEGHCLRHQVLDVCSLKSKSKAKRKFTFESGSLETLKSLVNSYGGITLLPSLATENIGESSTLVAFERPIPAREIGLVYRREHYKTEFLDALEESILSAIPEEVKKVRKKDLEVLPID
ncbi:MAG: hydrogen peroxide-inducible genes activator [Oligoflexia bacterium]|nr:hydrogen peroxide-inducible genes activator [Oligoflexia bacterium]